MIFFLNKLYRRLESNTSIKFDDSSVLYTRIRTTGIIQVAYTINNEGWTFIVR